MSTNLKPKQIFLEELRALHIATSQRDRRPILPQALLTSMCDGIGRIYDVFAQPPISQTPPTADSYRTCLDVTLQALNAYRDALPSWLFSPKQSSLLNETRIFSFRDAHQAFGHVIRTNARQFQQAVLVVPRTHMYPAYYLDFDEPMPRFTEPEPWFQEREPRFYENEPYDPEDKVNWRNSKSHFQAGELANWKEAKREFEATEIPAWKQRKRDFDDFEVARWKERKSQYEKLQKQHSDRSPDELAFIGTPFYGMWLMLKPELTYQLPFAIENKWRFGSQFVVGASRTGKTTFLTAQIMEDLDRVARGEGSVIVMESQNEDLIPHLAQLKVFGKGGTLEGKLIYLEPAKTPIASNIFDFGTVSGISDDDRDELFRTAFDNIEFFLNSVFAADTSSHQITMLKYLTQAMPHIQGGNVFTLQQLMTEEGLAEHIKYFDKLDRVVLKWLQTKLLGPDFKATRTAVSNRLDFLVADPIFRKMFGAPDNALDLFWELQKPKVLLINTAGLGGTLEAFGRYFIAKLDEAMLKRKFTPKSAKLPVYFYVDEASEYFANEPRVGKVIDRLGKQMLATIFAVQGTDQLSPAVLSVLQRAAIQAWTLTPPIVNISVNRQEPQAINVTRVELKDLPWVLSEDFEWMRQTMKVRYGRLNTREEANPPFEPDPQPTPTPESPQPQPSAKAETARAAPPPKQPPPSPDADETDAKPW